MTDLMTLQDRIASLSNASGQFSEHGRDLMKPHRADPLIAMRNEIDETQLHRRLVFRNDQDQTLGLHVASGRVLRLADPVSPELSAECQDLVSQDLCEENQAQISALGAILQGFASDTQALFVQSHIPSDGHDVSNLGIPGHKLFQACADPVTSAEPGFHPRDLEAFVENCSSIATAILRIEGEETSFEQGSAEHLKLLTSLAESERGSTAGSGGEAVQESCVIVGGHPETGHGILCAANSQNLVFAMFEIHVLAEIFDLWMGRTDQPPEA